MKIKRIVLAGATSGVGKTSITCAIIYALQKRGFSVQSFKVGPDYIDPSYLSTISKNETYNLDVWLMGKKQVLDSFVSHSNSDISIIEGVMGYYDGFGGKTNYASTHHVATLLKVPVILILDASKTSRSILFGTYSPKSTASSVVCVEKLSKVIESTSLLSLFTYC